MTTRIKAASLLLSAATLVGVAMHEGYTDRAVIPVRGDVPTVGFGTTSGVRLGDKTTPPRALVRLLADADNAAQAVRRCAPVPMYQHEFDAFVSLTYNVGAGNFCGSTLVRKLKVGDYAGACAQILRWNRAGGRVVRGLTQRRQTEYKKCLGAS